MRVQTQTYTTIYSAVIGAGWPDQMIRVDAPTSRGRVPLCVLSITLVPLCANACFACLSLSCRRCKSLDLNQREFTTSQVCLKDAHLAHACGRIDRIRSSLVTIEADRMAHAAQRIVLRVCHLLQPLISQAHVQSSSASAKALATHPRRRADGASRPYTVPSRNAFARAS
jgi:hypothetical protein